MLRYLLILYLPKPGIEIKFTLGITRRNGINIIEKEDDLFTEFKLF